MMKENLEFYSDNDLNEIIEERTQNRFLALEIKPVQKTINNFIKPITSTSEALSNLANKTKQNKIENLSEQKFMPLNDIVKKAQKLAKAAENLVELRKAVEEFDGCDLKKMATNTVFCDGNADSKIMVIGEAPGNHEDLQGIPFCGDSGKLLDAMFASINLDRTKFYITNVIFWRPPGNRRPTEEELAICRPFVERHIELVDPKIIILVGATSMSAVLGINDPVTGVRGKIVKYDAKFMNKKIDSFVVFHPSYLMRQSGKKRVAWRDMLMIEKILQER
ncbi:MAG TPA: uracil-DNA glycosylase [Rickettsiales bacterium]|nr:uracil-DNA glycosylase [Rickettsiales bacterium]